MTSQLQHGGDLLILLLDTPLLLEGLSAPGAQGHRAAAGAAAGGQLQSSSLLEQVLYFVAAYLMISDNNLLAVYGLMDTTCEVLHASVGEGTPEWPGSNNPTRSIHTRLMDLMQRHPQDQAKVAAGAASRTLPLSAGLSRALCLVHRLQSGREGTWGAAAAAPNANAAGAPGRARPRILCVLSAPDAPQQYVPTMNAIFSAQRAEVAIDTLMLGPTNSVYLQQAAHLTGGLYMHAPPPGTTTASAVASRSSGQLHMHSGGSQLHQQQQQQPTSSHAALQYLLSCMACDLATRSMLCVHQPLGVDFRASCFCHKAPVDVGYVCSVCLSIFCTPRAECQTCGTQFGSDKVA